MDWTEIFGPLMDTMDGLGWVGRKLAGSGEEWSIEGRELDGQGDIGPLYRPFVLSGTAVNKNLP